MRIQRKLVLTTFGAICTLALFALWVLLTHPSSARRLRCQVRVSTVAITNDTAGTRYATFGLSNVGQHAVFVLPPYALQNHSGQWRPDLMPKAAKTLNTNLMGVLPYGAKRLNPAESCRVTLVLPFDDHKWRASFFYYEIWPPVAGDVHQLFIRLGWRKREEGQLVASTDWTEQ